MSQNGECVYLLRDEEGNTNLLSDCLNVYLYFIHMKYEGLSSGRNPQIHLGNQGPPCKRGREKERETSST